MRERDRDCACTDVASRSRTGHCFTRVRSLSIAAVLASSLLALGISTVMLGDDEDVFDSVTWESPTVPTTYEGPSTVSGPGFRQSTSESEDGRGPHDPKWEGYLITTVKDPVKELAETKDAYVSYLVSAKVRPHDVCYSTPSNSLDTRPTSPSSLPLLRLPGDDSRTLSSCEKV